MKIVTRFAPSPTGYLHIGGARTALFNWLFARRNGGEFHIRIEDTDRDRNVAEAIQPIIEGLQWLGLDHDGETVFQSTRVERHAEVARQLLASGNAYRCYVSADELTAMRENAQRDRTPFKFESPWRDVDEARFEGRGGHCIPYAIRLKMPREGSTIIDDLVQGTVEIENTTLDDMIIMRADGTPTYMLASVVDDHDTGVTHVVRGDDHLNNAFRQLPIYRAMGWAEPTYAHLPLIFDEAGKKLSKRHGAAGLETYREQGYLSDTIFNYLLRMGWGHGDHEIISRAEALDLFSLSAVGKAPARIDQKRLDHLNGVYIRQMADVELLGALVRFTYESPSEVVYDHNLMASLIPLIKERVTTLVEARTYIDMVLTRPSTKVDDPHALLLEFNERLWRTDFLAPSIKEVANKIADETGMKLKHVVAPLRLAIMGSKVSPPLFEVMELLGGDECQERLHHAITGVAATPKPPIDYAVTNT
jgi:glutamyl-tRNA synthetase